MNYTKDKNDYLRELKILKFIYELCLPTLRLPHHNNWYFRIFITIIVISPHFLQIFVLLREIFSESFYPPPLWCHTLLPLCLIPWTEISKKLPSSALWLELVCVDGGGRSCWLSTLTSPVLSVSGLSTPASRSRLHVLPVTTITSSHVNKQVMKIWSTCCQQNFTKSQHWEQNIWFVCCTRLAEVSRI